MYEYRVIECRESFHHSEQVRIMPTQEFRKQINELAQQGWRVIHSYVISSPIILFAVLERAKK